MIETHLRPKNVMRSKDIMFDFCISQIIKCETLVELLIGKIIVHIINKKSREKWLKNKQMERDFSIFIENGYDEFNL